MKKLLMAFVITTVIVVYLRAAPGQRNRERGVGTAPGAGNESHGRRIPRPRAEFARTIDEAIEMSTSDLLGPPVGNGERATGPVERS